MFSPEQLNALAKDVMAKLGNNCTDRCEKKDKQNESNNAGRKCGISITPSQALVIAGVLSGALEVYSVQVDRNQVVGILLAGSLKQKTQLEKIIDQIGNLPFDEVVKSFLDRL